VDALRKEKKMGRANTKSKKSKKNIKYADNNCGFWLFGNLFLFSLYPISILDL